jgi:alpha-glucosidase
MAYQGNTLTTVIPVPRHSVHGVVTIEVRRAPGLMARRNQLDGFAGEMTRLRETYDAVNKTLPVTAPPDVLTEAMQTGDRLGCHPEQAREEISHFHQMLPQAQAAVQKLAADFAQRMDAMAERMHPKSWEKTEFETQEQQRTQAMRQAQALAADFAQSTLQPPFICLPQLFGFCGVSQRVSGRQDLS